MRNLLLAAALASSLIGLASESRAQQTRVSPFQNGMGFSYGADGSHDTYVFRNGALTDQHFAAPQPMQQPTTPLCADPDYGTGCGY